MKAEVRKATALFKRVVLGSAGVVLAVAATPTFAFAEEAEPVSGIAVILPNMLEFIPMLIGFVLLCFVLGKFGWPVFAAMIEKRENSIRDSLEKSEAARVESERLLEEYKQQLSEAKAQSAQIIADAKKTGESIVAELNSKAHAEAEDMIAKARIAIEAEKKAAVAELQSTVADASVNVASRLIGANLSEQEHRAIIERYVNEAGNLNAN